MPDVPARKDHSLFHATAQAHCQTDWANLRGTERIRTCSYCHAIVFKLDDLSEEESRQLILSTGRSSDETIRLSRRTDGTFVCESLPCSPSHVIFGGPVSAARIAARLICTDWRLSACFISVIILSLAWMFPQLPWGPVSGGAILVMSAIWCLLHAALTLAYSRHLDRSTWHLANLIGLCGRSFANLLCYVGTLFAAIFGCSITFGLILSVFPVGSLGSFIVAPLLLGGPVIVASRACLGLPIVCLENKGGAAALGRSFELSKGATMLIMTHLSLPAVLWVILWLVFSNSLLAGRVMGISLYVFLTLIVTCACVPIQVNLYRQLKARQDLRNRGLLPLLSTGLLQIKKK